MMKAYPAAAAMFDVVLKSILRFLFPGIGRIIQLDEKLVLFYEYFHGDTGCGLGASHQTGWTSLVADLIGGSEVKNEEWKEGSGHEIFIDEYGEEDDDEDNE